MGDADDGTHYACMGVGNMCKVSVYSSPFCCEPKTALKNKVFFCFSFLSFFFFLFLFFFFFYKKSRKETQNKTKKVLFKLWFRFLREGASKAVVWLQSLIGLVIA